LLRDAIESSREELGLGAEVLEDDRLANANAGGDVGHARLFVAFRGEERNGCIEDGGSAGGGIQAPAP
jgi:hypothetical protein